jgi:hypothetical protein
LKLHNQKHATPAQRRRKKKRSKVRRRNRKFRRHSGKYRRYKRRQRLRRRQEQEARRTPGATTRKSRQRSRQRGPNGGYLSPKFRVPAKKIHACHQRMLQSLARRAARVRDVHCKSVHYLTKHHVVLYCKFPWKKLLRRPADPTQRAGTLSTRLRRRLYLLAHGMLYERLLSKAQEVGCCVIECLEDCTSKGCCRCATYLVSPRIVMLQQRATS